MLSTLHQLRERGRLFLARQRRTRELNRAKLRVGTLHADLVMAQATQLFNTERICELRIRLDAARRALAMAEKQAGGPQA
jgi:hypothetical protein